jgi:hypothetical protein
MIIWRDVPIIINEKGPFIQKRGGGYVYKNAFHKDHGSIPVAYINPVTCKFEEVVNTRGYAYALRRAKKYRKKPVSKVCYA